MVQRCVNPNCHEEFKLLNAGDLYVFGRGSAELEFFWLCAGCASKFDPYLDPEGRVSVKARSADRAQPADSEVHFRLISRTRKPAPRPRTMPSGEHASSFVFLTGPIPSAFHRGGRHC